jgi:hypothetical protein
MGLYAAAYGVRRTEVGKLCRPASRRACAWNTRMSFPPVEHGRIFALGLRTCMAMHMAGWW